MCGSGENLFCCSYTNGPTAMLVWLPFELLMQHHALHNQIKFQHSQLEPPSYYIVFGHSHTYVLDIHIHMLQDHLLVYKTSLLLSLQHSDIFI